MKKLAVLLLTLQCVTNLFAQEKKVFTHADTLRGSITPERAWWDVLRYDLTVQPDYDTKTITGVNKITYKVVSDSYPAFMQIDLQEPMMMDSVIFGKSRKMEFTREGNAFHVQAPKQKQNSVGEVTIYYHGKPREAVHPPWDGGWLWKKDEKGRPWMTVTCQEWGASVWYPCKDHQSDEPDNGATLSIIVPDSLVAVGNGRMISKKSTNGLTNYIWEVKNPIDNYAIIPYIGKYVNFTDTLQGAKGTLDLSFWVLDYDLDIAKQHFKQIKPMLHSMEYWFGPYPFYDDSYKLVESSHLGMEHQSAVAYGNHFLNGYLGSDLSGTGWGLKWDYILEHESAHEWWGNNMTAKDNADMWIHESFADYSEALYTEYAFGKNAGNEYIVGSRLSIQNEEPIIGKYDVNQSGSTDMYPKGGNMLQTIRHVINNDELFRSILTGLNKEFYHQTVVTKQIEDYISEKSKIDLSKVFDQYLRTAQIPYLLYSYDEANNAIYYKWSNCVDGFNMPLNIISANKVLHLSPTQKWQKLDDVVMFDTQFLLSNYYIVLKQVQLQTTQN